MARKQNREFSEGEFLSAPEYGAREEREPLWPRPENAVPGGKTEDRETGPDTDKPASAESAPDVPPAVDDPMGTVSDEEAAPVDGGLPPEEEAPEESGEEGPAPERPPEGEEVTREQVRKNAEEAWHREAQRVESTMFARRRLPGDRLDPQEAEEGKGKHKKKRRKSSKRKKKKSSGEPGFLRRLAVVLVCSVLFVMVALTVVSSFVDNPYLAIPKRIVATVVSPVQRFFSRISDGVVDYLRMLKVRGNIEYEYEQLRIQMDEYATLIAQDEELRHQVQELYELLDERNAEGHLNMHPLAAQVIGTDSGSYFSTLTLDKGSSDDVSEYMAVVAQGGLVGVTYDVTAHTCKVRCIINSDCSIPGLVSSSRDQGTVKGTLGTNGEPMCRMYYLPDTTLPRPGDLVVTSGVGLEFPKGIPIGYIRESTRGMEDNKSYVVLEPVVDFQHLEYVTVYRYRPAYAEQAQARTSTSSTLTLETLDTARPVPTFQAEGVSDFLISITPAPTDQGTITPGPATTAPSGPAQTPAATRDPNATTPPPNLEYQAADLSGRTPTPSPRPTNTPAPTPAPTQDPGDMLVEEEDE